MLRAEAVEANAVKAIEVVENFMLIFVCSCVCVLQCKGNVDTCVSVQLYKYVV